MREVGGFGKKLANAKQGDGQKASTFVSQAATPGILLLVFVTLRPCVQILPRTTKDPSTLSEKSVVIIFRYFLLQYLEMSGLF